MVTTKQIETPKIKSKESKRIIRGGFCEREIKKKKLK
jgi:hypothetical protein